MSKKDKEKKTKEDKDELPAPWDQIQGAIWLIGLAILAWQGWWWPGILVLVAISGLTQAAIQFYLSRQTAEIAQTEEEKKQALERGSWLPAACPGCGAPLSVASVRWTGPNTADCPYCSMHIKP